MHDIAILLWKYKKLKKIDSLEKWFFDLVGRAIVYFTDMPYTHVAIVLKNKTYESSVWQKKNKWYSGIRKSNRVLKSDEIMIPDKQIPEETIDFMIDYVKCLILEEHPYNFFKLLALANSLKLRKSGFRELPANTPPDG